MNLIYIYDGTITEHCLIAHIKWEGQTWKSDVQVKQTIYKTDALGNFLLDSNGDKIIRNYQRYWPDWTSMETWGAVFFIILGIFVLLALDWYGRNRKERKKVRAGR